jgi:hypothetical protein
LRVFSTRSFERFRRRERIDDRSLCEGVARAERGLIDANLGSGLIKQRVARRGQGRSRGFRVLVVYRSRVRAVFLYGFAKNERDNVDADELVRLRPAASEMLSWTDSQISQLLAATEWRQIECDDEEAQG